VIIEDIYFLQTDRTSGAQCYFKNPLLFRPQDNPTARHSDRRTIRSQDDTFLSTIAAQKMEMNIFAENQSLHEQFSSIRKKVQAG